MKAIDFYIHRYVQTINIKQVTVFKTDYLR